MTILTAISGLKVLNQATSNFETKSSLEIIGATGKNYSVFTTNSSNKPTNYFSPENLGKNLATNLQDYVKKNGNFDNLQKIELAPKLTANQKDNGFADNIASEADERTINASTRYLSAPENKEALTKMCELYGIKDPDYKKLEEAMIKSNKNNDMTISRDEIEAYKKSQVAINGKDFSGIDSQSNNEQKSDILSTLKQLLSFLSQGNNSSAEADCHRPHRKQHDSNHFNHQQMGYNQNSPYFPNQQMGYNQNSPFFPNQQMGYNQNLPFFPNQQMGYNQNSPFFPNQQMGYNQNSPFFPNQQMGYNSNSPYFPNQQMGYNQNSSFFPNQQMGYNQDIVVSSNNMNTSQRIFTGLFTLLGLIK